MTVRIVPASLATVLIAVCCMKSVGDSPQALDWHDADIGASTTGGQHTFADGTLTVRGMGKGEDGPADELHFTSTTIPAGDVEVVARITALEDASGTARAGIMLRAAKSPTATKASAGFTIDKKGTHSTYCRYFDPSAPQKTGSGGYHTSMKLPFWLRLVRTGKDFAAFRSQDGRIWSQMHNVSGGVFTPEGPFEAGFFVASGDQATTATATFDNITVGKPQLAYRSSWIGNTFAQDSTGHVSNSTTALWVGLDGTCYTNSPWDEAGEASKIYKDGKVVTSFRKENEMLGNSFCGEGTITSDGKHTYLAAGHGLYQSDMLGHNTATQPIYFATSLWDEKKQINLISGMAVVGGELFIGDSHDQKIRVAHPDRKHYYTAGNTSINQINEAIDFTAVANAAPASVYQSQRECDHLPYQVPGLQPDAKYTVRLHFAEYKHEKAGQRVMDVYAGGQRTKFDIFAAAGAKHKAAVLDLAEAATDKDGILTVALTRGDESPDRHIVICGIEVLSADSKRVFALNCGGPAVGGFQSEVHELSERAFEFERPGPMTADKRGNLWIIQEANDFPVGNKPTTKYPGVIKCYRTDGTFTGRQIIDVVNPTALGYDATNDRLLIAENGPDQNIRIYHHLESAPQCTSTFGEKGGIYVGKTPGLLHDPLAGGWARFYGLNGVGVDAQNNIYVSCGSSGTDLRKYTPDGALVWKLNGLHFVDCGDFDPDGDGTQVYTPYKHYTMDYSKTAPGSEWTYAAYNWDPSKYGEAPRPNCASAVVRRLGDKRNLFLYTSGQGLAGHIGIFRFDGEIAVPCGRLDGEGKNQIWIDANGDGKQTDDETKSHLNGGFSTFAVDRRGDIWTVVGGDTFYLRHYRLQGFNEYGVPLYSAEPADVEQIHFPTDAGKNSPWGQVGRVSYDSDRDVMYLIGPRSNRKPDGSDNPLNYLARYDNWSSGNRTAKWIVNLPNPDDDPNFMYTPPYPYNLPFHWMAFDVADDKIFVAELWGPVHVFDAATGVRDTILSAGPEISGGNAWEDEQMGIRAFKRKNGEYVILTENSGYRAKNNLFRWIPSTK